MTRHALNTHSELLPFEPCHLNKQTRPARSWNCLGFFITHRAIHLGSSEFVGIQTEDRLSSLAAAVTKRE